jgi:hypothetical protein
LNRLSIRPAFDCKFSIPFALSAVGFAIIWLGVLWQRRETEWSARLRKCLPASMRELINARAVR